MAAIKETVKALALEHIRLEPKLQMRDCIDQDHVDRLAEVLAEGKEFDGTLPIVYQDGMTNWLADGWHRHGAHGKAGIRKMKCLVRQGTDRDAFLYALSANAKHGLHRSNADKTRSVEAALDDPELAQLSDRELGKRCGVGNKFVGDIRRKREAAGSMPEGGSPVFGTQVNRTVTGADGKTYDVSNIGKRQHLSQRKSHLPEHDKTPEEQANLRQSVEALFLQYPEADNCKLAELGGVSEGWIQSVRVDVEAAKKKEAVQQYIAANPEDDDSKVALACQTTAGAVERVRGEKHREAVEADPSWVPVRNPQRVQADPVNKTEDESVTTDELPACLRDDLADGAVRKSEPHEGTGVFDDYKRPVPVELVEAFGARTEARSLKKKYGAMYNQIMDARFGPNRDGVGANPGYAGVPHQTIYTLTENLQTSLEHSVPKLVCPKCDGAKRADGKPCYICKARGFLSKDQLCMLQKEPGLESKAKQWMAKGDADEGDDALPAPLPAQAANAVAA